MNTFMDNDFMLHNELSKKLYHEYAKNLPIIDYHCHLNPREIYENKPFSNLTDAWLSGDHYKWRLMRTYGIPEQQISGDASDELKFKAWAEVVPHMFGNPVFHFTQLELKTFFNITEMLSLDNYDKVYQHANDRLSKLTPQKIIELSYVETLCTTDDPVDTLEWHKLLIHDKSFKTQVLPAFRPDKAVNIELDSFFSWLSKLEQVTDLSIKSLADYEKALITRIEHFAKLGAKLSDHALDYLYFEHYESLDIINIFNKRIQRENLTEKEIGQFKTYMMTFFAKQYHLRNWVQQYHIGANRNVNKTMYAKFGPDTGFDAIHDQAIALPLQKLLDHLNSFDILPKTIIYTLNPNQFDIVIPLMQAYQDGSMKGKIQFGSAWWFSDSIDGMRKQMKALQNYGLFSSFIGMLTDSRSFLSYSRHDYFRRLLCQLVSEEVLNGYYPYDINRLGKLVEDIAYHNVKNYLAL
jgi:glucuronate isomerase